MKQLFIFSILLCYSQLFFSQDLSNTIIKDSIDTKYKEDQYYLGITYNALSKMPDGMSQNGFSSGFHFGFIKDIPINKNRDLAFGIGLGYSTNSINNNLRITKIQEDVFLYELLNDSQFTKNKFVQHLVELPLEFRWRTSTADSYKFWRIYSGIKLGYVFASNTKFQSASEKDKNNSINDFNEFQYGLTLAIGYGSWNAYINYTLNPIFKKEAKLNSYSIDAKMLKIGIMFYIL